MAAYLSDEQIRRSDKTGAGTNWATGAGPQRPGARAPGRVI